MKNQKLIIFFFLLLKSTFASFYDRADYFQNKETYDEASTIIDILYDQKLSEKEKSLRLAFQNQKLVPTFKKLKNANEMSLLKILKEGGTLNDNEIERRMNERATIDALKVTLENDFVASTDRFYTHGTQIELSFNNKGFERFFKKLGYKHTDFYFLCNQSIYNSSDRNVETIQINEPGYAGILYCGLRTSGLKIDKKTQRMKMQERFELMVGTLGKNSLSKEVQNAIHRLIGDKELDWEFQVEDKFYFHVGFERHYKIAEGNLFGDSRPDYNVIISGGGKAGSVVNQLHTGVLFNYRLLGSLIDMYITQSIRPSQIERLSMMTPAARAKEVICKRDWNVNLFAGAKAIGVISNGRLDNTRYNVESKASIFDLKGGFVVNYKDVYLEFALITRTSEWRGTETKREAPSHTYGSLSFTVPFRKFKDLGSTLTKPLKWATNKEYRQELREVNQFRKQVRKEGITMVFDENDRTKDLTIKCN